MNIQVLDCTLRDGGYVNGWNFSPNIVQGIISDLSSSRLILLVRISN